ncbi:MAG: HU family DNA-binding protein [Erysipelotrichaceae bacterium]|nr:HU family DNA-binding protein [Erysipelotrichaceae bacterium]
MNKKELVDAVSEKKNLTKKEAEALVDTVFNTITDSLLSGDKVLISGFGTFKVNHRRERIGVSPKTKELMTIPASKTLTFKPSNRLKDTMNIDKMQ